VKQRLASFRPINDANSLPSRPGLFTLISIERTGALACEGFRDDIAAGRELAEQGTMNPMTAGVTKAGTGLDGISWNILGQTYVPKQLSENSFAWHATFPPGTFVPPHIHPTQDEFIYMLDGKFDLILEGREFTATTGDLIRLPMQIPHGIFNKTDQTVKCFFWVTPTRKLYDLFWAIHGMKEQNPPDVIALSAKYEVMFLPPPA
jgi:quercetin dioxygenase-like cupin family protein